MNVAISESESHTYWMKANALALASDFDFASLSGEHFVSNASVETTTKEQSAKDNDKHK